MPANYTQTGSIFYFSNNRKSGNDTSIFLTADQIGVDTTISESYKLFKNHLEVYDLYARAVNNHRPVSSRIVGSSSTTVRLDNDDVLKRYESFKKFDTVVDFTDYFYSKQNSDMN